jgi:hypothetical protein
MTAVDTEHSRFAEWDAAYLLGSLSPADRRTYEEHLETCPICTAAVGELAGVPGALAALPRGRALALLEPDDDPGATPANPDLVPALLGRVRRIRRRRRWTTVAIAAVSAVIVVGLTLTVPTMLNTPPAGATVTTSLQQDAPSATALSADVTLTTKKWGTSIGMVCRWAAVASPYAEGTSRWDYGLWIVTSDGRSQRVATWSAGPGDVVRTTDSTEVPLDRIVRLELRSIDGKTLLLSAPVVHSS